MAGIISVSSSFALAADARIADLYHSSSYGNITTQEGYDYTSIGNKLSTNGFSATSKWEHGSKKVQISYQTYYTPAGYEDFYVEREYKMSDPKLSEYTVSKYVYLGTDNYVMTRVGLIHYADGANVNGRMNFLYD